MVAFFQQHTAVQFQCGSRMPDMREGDGSARGGRSLCALPYDGRLLGPWLHKLRPPLDIVSLAGMGIAGGADMAAFFNATRSPTAALHVGNACCAMAATCCCTGAACSWSMATPWWHGCCAAPWTLA